LIPAAFVKAKRARTDQDDETWETNRPAPTLNSFDNNHETRATVLAIHQNQRGEINTSDIAYSLNAGGGKPSQGHQVVHTVFGMSQHAGYTEGVTTLTATDHKRPEQNIVTDAVRRLTPIECERLMGWPDNWTQTTADGKQQADSHRYRQCGNGVVANVAQWIGLRLHDAQQVNP